VENCADDERGGGEMAVVVVVEDILPGIPAEGNLLRGGDDEAVVVLVVDKEIRILQELNFKFGIKLLEFFNRKEELKREKV
jgi:hypothetical protein